MDGYAIVEQMGHRRVTGRVSEVEVCGVRMLRVETLSAPPLVTLVHPQSLFAVTPCSEERARRAASDYTPLRELEAPEPAPAWIGRGSGPDDERDDHDSPCAQCGAPEGEPCRDGCPAHDEEG